MPLLKSDFTPPLMCRCPHLQTVIPSLARKVTGIKYIRHRAYLADGDFVDLDWSFAGNGIPATAAVILCHGLEGHSQRSYMLGMARAFNQQGIDAVSYNYLGCSGEPNLTARVYTAGATRDLHEVIGFAKALGHYKSVYLVGFSLGGNLVLKYTGEMGGEIDPDIKGVAAISAPCDLRSSGIELSKPKNRLYNLRFIKMLRHKIMAKYKYNPELKSIDLDLIHTLKQFDDLITAPLNGFKDAEDYWTQASSIRVLGGISVPTLILNAADDPMLGPECYPKELAAANPNVILDIPRYGGHMGFMHRPNDQEYWHETRTIEFLAKQ
ncbi:MAG: YheT family hydrolase [Ignavibacteriales bacterium]